MTGEEAKKILQNSRKELIDYKGVNNSSAEALYIAIKSLEAWDKVLNDIKEIDNMPNWQKHNSGYWNGFSDVVDIIGKRLREVEE